MNCQTIISHDPLDVTRRYFFGQCGVGLGKIALAGLLAGLRPPGDAARPRANPLAPQAAALRRRRRSGSSISSWPGAPSQLDLFDYKPKLAEFEGKPIPPSVIGGQRYAFIRPDAAVLGPRFKLPSTANAERNCRRCCRTLAKIVDDICLIKSVHTDQFNHAPAQISSTPACAARPAQLRLVGALRTGSRDERSAGVRRDVDRRRHQRRRGQLVERIFAHGLSRRAVPQPGRPDSQRLAVRGRRCRPAARHARSGRRAQSPAARRRGRSRNRHADRLLRNGLPPADLRSGTDGSAQREQATLEMYGADPDKPSFARACLLARRMIERGVRFVNIYHEGWDAHSDVSATTKKNCGDTDQARPPWCRI